MLRIGLIARAEYARGLAIQSKGFYDHMPVERVMLVTMPRPDCDTDASWYPGALEVVYDDINHELDKRVVMDFMSGLDVVFTVETPYDWRLPDWARSIGVKTVIQGNPEFYRHGNTDYENLAHPDCWWWPTRWRLERLPRGRHVPVPMPDEAVDVAAHGGRLRLLHVTGKRAYADRNGTDVVMDALRAITADVDFTIQGFGWELPEMSAAPNVNLIVDRVGVPDRWSMYADHHLLIMPRRYGGLCLPALEAAACGLGVVMPDVSPNYELASGFLSCRYDRVLNFAAGRMEVADVTHMDLAKAIDYYAQSPESVAWMQAESASRVLRWSEMRSVYMDELERVVDEVEG